MTKHIRNFCIIAHIDHGKSTLADRLIEYTGAMEKRDIKDRVLDTLELEQERGITIKLQTARLKYNYTGDNAERGEYILNLIDTPGHVDFSYEVSRSVAASEGALILVDVTQGIQAQTLSTVYKAMEYDLKLIPVLNKVDLPNAEVDRVQREVIETFGFDESEIILASGKTGIGSKEILDAIVERIAPPDKNNSMIYVLGDESSKPKTPTVADIDDITNSVVQALVFDAFYHEYKGVVALVKVVSGNISAKKELYLLSTDTIITPIEIGYLSPKMNVSNEIFEGEVGYVATGLKDIKKVHSGDTLTIVTSDGSHKKVRTLLGYQKPLSMVYASLYPVEADEYPQFVEAVEKLSLNDSAFTYEKEYSTALGSGFVCGFLGLLHLEVTQERLDREFNIDLISTTPTVEFKIKLATKDYSKVPAINVSKIDPETNIATIRTAAEFPDGSLYEFVEEPWVKMEIMTPDEYVGGIMELAQANRGNYVQMSYTSKGTSSKKHAVLIYEMPTVEIITNFFDKLKSISRGYASMDYSFIGYRRSEISKVSILINNEEVTPLSFLSHKNSARRRAKDLVEKLKDIIPKQNFKVPIQAGIGGDIIARETIQAYRKDVTAGMYGGDESRKKKLLDKQKKGKKRAKMFGKVEVPKEAFLAALKV